MTQPPDQWGRQPDPYQQGGYPQEPHPQGGYQQGAYQPNPQQGGFPQPGHQQGGYQQGGVPQGGYQQPGAQQGAYQFDPYAQHQFAPGGPFPPPGNSRRGLILSLSVGLLVLIVAAVATILVVNNNDDSNAGGGGGGQLPSSEQPYPSPPSDPSTGSTTEQTTDQTSTDETTTEETTTEPTTTDETSTEPTTTDETTTDETTTDATDATDDEKLVIAANQSFWDAVKDADYDKVADLTCERYRSKLPDSLKKYLDGREKDLVVTIEGATVSGSTARVQETVKFPGEKTDTAPWDMKYESGAWLMCDY